MALILQIIGGILGLWIAVIIIPGVEFTAGIEYLMLAGISLGLINFFIKPIIKLITLPLRILTLGLFSLIINLAIIWLIDVAFPELIVPDFLSLLGITLIVWLISLFLGIKRKR